MKRILIFSLTYDPYIGGAEVALKEITNNISEEYEFHMITSRFDSSLPREEKVGRIHIYRIGPTRYKPTHEELLKFPLYLAKVVYPILAFFKAFALQLRYNYDAVWSMMTYMGFPAVFLKLFFWNTKIILTLQDGDSISHIVERKRIQIIYPIFMLIFKMADFVQAISYYLEKYAKDMGYTGETVVIPNGVKKEFFQEMDNEKREEIRRKYGISLDDVVLITISRLVAKNDVESLISSMAYLPSKYKLLILGDGPLAENLQKKTSELGLEERVNFLGELAHADLPLYLNASDVFVRASLSEGLGIAFLEALAAGVPIVGTPVGGIVDFLKDVDTYKEHGNGAYAQVKDPQSIANAIDKVTCDSTLYTALKQNGRTLAYDSYRWESVTERMQREVFDYMTK